MYNYHRHQGEFQQMPHRYSRHQSLVMLTPCPVHRDNAHRCPKNEGVHPNEPFLLRDLQYLGKDQNQDIHLEHILSFVHLPLLSSSDVTQLDQSPSYQLTGLLHILMATMLLLHHTHGKHHPEFD